MQHNNLTKLSKHTVETSNQVIIRTKSRTFKGHLRHQYEVSGVGYYSPLDVWDLKYNSYIYNYL